ncbi:DUF4412 domain-containing protein [Thermodesulfobacteriota bacterium B35]
MNSHETTAKRLRNLALLFLLALLPAASTATAALTSFVADKVVLDDSGRVRTGEKVFMAGEKIRAQSLTGDMVMIFRHDLGLLWALAPARKIYVEIPLERRKWERMTRGAADGDRVRVLGQEVVNGFTCTGKEVTLTRTVMGRTTSTTRTICTTPEIPMVLRSRSGSGITTELRNIHRIEPKEELFDLPPGYRKVGNNMGLFLMYMRGAAEPPTRIH